MSDEKLLFAADDPISKQNNDPWLVLVVDDDPDVHGAADIALHGLQVKGRPVRLLHAYSAIEADAFLDGEPTIAMLLLDVVMEGATAGLDFVNTVRKQRQMEDIRIVLCTGQPGYAPELDVVRDYDINDYYNKNMLYHARLVTMVTVNLRNYAHIQKLRAQAAK